MLERARTFADRIVVALPGFLEGRLTALGVDPVNLAAETGAVVESAGMALEHLLARPFDQQPETPLETVRRAIAPLGTSVAATGIAVPTRDEEQERVAPDDVYGLAPASAADLGEEVLEASLAWGLAKTTALSRPTLLVVTANLMDASRFEPAAQAAGYRMESSRDAEPSTTPLVAFVDLEHRGADEVIASLSKAGVRVVAYGPHVDDLALVRAKALGATAAEPRSRMFRNPSEHLRPLV